MKRTILIPIDQDMTPTQDDTPKEVKHMSQKYQALNAYQEMKDNYSASTSWRTLKTVAVSLLPADAPMPEDIDEFIEVVVSALGTNVKKAWGVDSNYYPLFVRACPLVPRPGVLESSRADTYDDVLIIARRIISTMMSPDTSDSPMYDHGITDPHGTVMVQPFINADASAVVAPSNYILMGRDNDGITAGKDGVRVAIPIPVDNKVDYDLTALNTSSDKIEIEFVSEMVEPNKRTALRYSSQPTQKWAMVQLRGTEGPRPIAPAPKGVSISGTFHGTERITIKHIHLVSDNTDEQLNEMEDALREGMPEGSVVLHPTGNHLSHHAGQCFKYGVPTSHPLTHKLVSSGLKPPPVGWCLTTMAPTSHNHTTHLTTHPTSSLASTSASPTSHASTAGSPTSSTNTSAAPSLTLLTALTSLVPSLHGSSTPPSRSASVSCATFVPMPRMQPSSLTLRSLPSTARTSGRRQQATNTSPTHASTST